MAPESDKPFFMPPSKEELYRQRMLQAAEAEVEESRRFNRTFFAFACMVIILLGFMAGAVMGIATHG